ncbi:hypothetical protein JWG39_15385 [Desulforhopalus vacuolatus]|uniref:hypothetical protein n=1 Tax=Desulforhopalus vacuolatus TaxID=40414 RepID=UPI001965D741|nr:hypothetical protein [Desulforhopalus vacuolatus]MBM9521202.1 hypothetical protein [Desulforhopalus vacuolatus]
MIIENISTDLIEKLYLAAIHLRDFIEMQPVSRPVLWCGDGKSKVTEMPHYKESCKSIALFESCIDRKATGT